MDTLIFVAFVVVVVVLAYKFAPGFKDKADKVVDKDGDGRPFW